MSTEAALLRAIRDLPDEDTPRLLYADFLEEDGYSPRAEFIRTQIERARMPEGDPRRDPLEERERELLGEHEGDWLGVPPDQTDELAEWEFERGFIHEIAASPVFMRGAGSGVCAAHPVRRWRVQSGRDNFLEDLKEAGQRGWVSRLEAVDLSGWYSGLGELSGFLRRSNWGRLRELDVTGLSPTETLPEMLEDAPFRDQLKVLRCGGTMYGEGGRLDIAELARALGRACRLEEFAAPGAGLLSEDLGDLFAAECFHALTSLDVSRNEISPDVWSAFRSAHCRLRELDVSRTPLGAISLDRLLDCPALSELRTLYLNGCGSAMANIRALAGSRFWTQAEELRIQQGSVPEHSLEPLMKAKGPPALRILDVAQNWLRDAGVAQLCEAPWAGSLQYLDLSENYLSDDALRLIARSGRFRNLRTLHLNYNSPYHLDGAEHHEAITDAGLRALAESPDLANLRILTVRGTRVTAAGVDAVLNAPHWRLSGLHLAQCQLRPNAIDVLASSPSLARLEVLDLSHNDDIGIDDLEQLAESEYLSPQTELNIRGIYGDNRAVREALRQRLGCRLSE